MKTLYIVLITLLLFGCGESHESLANDLNEELHQLALIMADIKGPGAALTFRDSKEEIESIGKEIQSIIGKINSLEKPTLEETRKIDEISRGPDSPMIRINKQVKRLKRLPGGYAFTSEIDKYALQYLKNL
tara:strand:+ start:112 stop:504 length:393 start_codon:yes stop_codon:yes gene_type:complete